MKTLRLIIVAALLMPLTLMAQTGPFDAIFEKYQDSDDVTSITINLNAIKINFGSDHDDIGDMFNQIDRVNILQFENHHKSFRNSDFYKEVNAIIEKNNYTQLIEIKSNDKNIDIYIIEGDNNIILEGLIIAQEDEEATIISVRGKMNPSDFASMHQNNFHQFSFRKHR